MNFTVSYCAMPVLNPNTRTFSQWNYTILSFFFFCWSPPQDMGDLSPLTRDGTHGYCSGITSLNLKTTREVHNSYIVAHTCICIYSYQNSGNTASNKRSYFFKFHFIGSHSTNTLFTTGFLISKKRQKRTQRSPYLSISLFSGSSWLIQECNRSIW